MITREKVKGMFLGVAIGDALGCPVESWSRERIAEMYPEGISDYKEPSGHKWFQGQPAGTWTDDTQLTIATAKGIIDANGFDLDAQAKAAVVAMKEAMKDGVVGGSGVPGWGYTTVKSVRNIANNVHWSESGKTTDPNLGHGNGVVMRQSPIVAWSLTESGMHTDFQTIIHNLLHFSAMTHYTNQSAIATLVHYYVLVGCFFDRPFNLDFGKGFIDKDFINKVISSLPLVSTKIDMWQQFQHWQEWENWDFDKIIQEFGGGSANVAHSLPFCYAFFAKNHKDIQLLYDVIAAGGDTDTNASILGGMLGALHGDSIFPKHLVDGLIGADQIISLSEEFCDAFKLHE